MASPHHVQSSTTLLEVSRTLEDAAQILRVQAGEPAPTPAPTITAPFVRRIVSARRLREEMIAFPLTDAAWAMLLELYAAHLERRRLPQTMLAQAARVPETTALRISERLVSAGLVTRGRDPHDRRALLLGLSDPAAASIAAYLAAILTEAPAAP